MFKINLLNPGGTLTQEGRPEQAPDKYWFCAKCGDKVKYEDVHDCWVYFKEQTQERIDTDLLL